jgi:hypothetical protein
LLTATPAILLYYFLVGTKIADVVDFVIALPILMHITVSSALVYAFALLNRFLGKELFQRFYFKNEDQMPTTNFLLNTDRTLSANMKNKITQKIFDDFDIRLPPAADEEADTTEARKQIIFAVSQIRNKTRGNSLLLQHNYEYGFIRNFLGGSVFALLICILNIVLFNYVIPNKLASGISIGLGIFFLIFILLSKWLIKRHGKIYAKVLFEQYLYSQSGDRS